MHIQISLGTKLELKLTIWFFGPNLPKKDTFGQKQKKLASPLDCTYSN